MIVVVDNRDSFVFNLARHFHLLGVDAAVVSSHAATAEAILAAAPAAIVISPGPCTPAEAGCSLDLVKRSLGRVPILGVCLGHQAIGRVFGGTIVHAKRLMHGKVSEVTSDGKGLFDGLGTRPFKAMRYHSLAIDRATLPADLIITAEAEDGEIMGVRHLTHATEGIQFHPESIMTAVGKRILRNFLKSTTRSGT